MIPVKRKWQGKTYFHLKTYNFWQATWEATSAPLCVVWEMTSDVWVRMYCTVFGRDTKLFINFLWYDHGPSFNGISGQVSF